MRITYAGLTDVGKMRDHNEDILRAEDQWFVVADGMGGHAAGEVASAIVGDTLEGAWSHVHNEVEMFKADAVSAEAVCDRMAIHVCRAHEMILETVDVQPATHGMGSTAVYLVIGAVRAFWAYVGDSRIYRLNEEWLTQLTTDHSLFNMLLAIGGVTPADYAEYPHKNVLTSSLGGVGKPQVDVGSEPLEAGTRYLLCSDGLNDMVGEADIERILRENEDDAAAAQALVDAANAAGGEDNITVIVVSIGDID